MAKDIEPYRSLFSTTIWSTAYRLVQFVADFGKNVLLLTVLTVESFGILNLINAFINSTKYLDIGVRQRYIVSRYAQDIDATQYRAIFQSVLIVELVLSGSLLLALLGYGIVFEISNPLSNIMSLLVIGIFLIFRIYRLSLIFFEAEKRFVTSAAIESSVSAVVLILVFLNRQSEYILLLLLVAQLTCYSVISLYISPSWLSSRFNFHWILVNLRESLLIGLATLLNGFSFYADRLLLITFFSLREVGLYAALLFVQNISQTLAVYLAKPLSAEIIRAAALGRRLPLRLKQAAVCFLIVPPLLAVIFFDLFESLASLLFINYFSEYSDLAEFVGLLILACSLLPALSLSGLVLLEPSMNAYKIFSASQTFPLFFLFVLYMSFQDLYSVFFILLTSTFAGSLTKIAVYIIVIGRHFEIPRFKLKIMLYVAAVLGLLFFLL